MACIDVFIGDEHVGRLSSYGEWKMLSCEFTYSHTWLRSSCAYPLSPDMPLTSRVLRYLGRPSIPGAIQDAGPDSWGEKLIRLDAGVRAGDLSVVDIIMMADDKTRMGNLRFYDGDTVLSEYPSAPACTSDLQDLAYTASRLAQASGQKLRHLASAGSSLGGARPKVTVVDDCLGMSVAKFPKSDDDDDVEAWETVALLCAKQCGMDVPEFRHMRISDHRSILLVSRFDRRGEERIGYISAHTAMQLADSAAPYSFELLANTMDVLSADPRADKRALFDRIALSILLDNVDDHMRNYGFVRVGNGWRLAPIFDVTPDFRAPAIEATRIMHSGSGFNRTIEQLIDAAEVFGLTTAQARMRVCDVAQGCSNFISLAQSIGITELDDSVMVRRIEARIRKFHK